MAEPTTSFEQLDRAIGQVLDAETTNFFALADILGLDPKSDFAGADLSHTDLSGCDLSGANFVDTDLTGANLNNANLQNADLTGANLGRGPSHLNRNDTIVTARNLALALVYDLVSARSLASEVDGTVAQSQTVTRMLSNVRGAGHTLSEALDRARALDGSIERSVVFNLDRNRMFERAGILARDVNHARDFDRTLSVLFALTLAVALTNAMFFTFALSFGLTATLALANALTFAIALVFVLGIALSRNRNRTRDLTHNLVHDLDYCLSISYQLVVLLSGGANLYNANLSGAKLDGANVDGAVMVNCTGLSAATVDNLKQRGALCEELPVNHLKLAPSNRLLLAS